MCSFFLGCHTTTLASDQGLGQPDWRNLWGQFSQKKVWLRVRENGGLWKVMVGMSVTSCNAQKQNPQNF
jgi:hypothetical protein